MKSKKIGPCTLYCGKMEDIDGGLRFDHILTDPPYLYIKTHDFDKEFDEKLLFENARRVMPDDGFIALFGRGTSFYRWNTRLAELGFVFKEEIVWDKRYTSSPCIAISRIHETVSIHTKKTGKIHRSKVPYVEQKQYDLESIANDIKRIKSAISTEAGLNKVLAFLQGEELYEYEAVDKHCVSQQPGIKKPDRASATINSIKNGMKERSIFCVSTPRFLPDRPRVFKTLDSIRKGMQEKTIISYDGGISGGTGIVVRTDFPKERREISSLRMICDSAREKSIIELASSHYGMSHPTQKPVRLAERLLALISDPGDAICDPFMGSGSFGVACVRTGRKYIGSEISREYFDTACKRIEDAYKELRERLDYGEAIGA